MKQKDIICEHCHKRKGTVRWVGDTGVMGWIHGMSQWWCKRCVLEAQIKYAEEHKDDLKNLQAELKKLKN